MNNELRSLLIMDDAPGYAAPRQPVAGWSSHEVWRTLIHTPRAPRIEAVGATAKNRGAGIVDDASAPRSAMPALAPTAR